METLTHTYRGKEYGLTIDGRFWFLDCSNGLISGDLPIKPKEVNQGIRDWKQHEAEKKANAPRCKVCNKTPYDIEEYQSYAKQENMDPLQWVRENERFTPDGRFYCTRCYIKAGMPLW